MKLRTSPSQLDNYIACPRKWWFKSIHRVPEPPRAVTGYGDVAHAVCDRVLQGQPPYPKDWHIPVDRFSRKKQHHLAVSMDEQVEIQALIQKAIQDGILSPEPDGKPEMSIEMYLGAGAVLKGYIDYATHDTVQDHKFIGARSGRYYQVGHLSAAVAMNIYGAHLVEAHDLESVWLRYNLFTRGEALSVRRVEVEKSRIDLREYMTREIAPCVQGMMKHTQQKLPTAQWQAVEGDDRRQEACRAYGGCPYMDICFGKCTVEEHTRRLTGGSEEARQQAMDSLLGEKKTTTEPAKEKKKMALNLIDRITQAKAPVEETKAPIPEAPIPEAPAPETTGTRAAPWAVEGCVACRSNPIPGLSSKFDVCKICAIKRKALGGPQPADYKIMVEEGMVIISPKGAEDDDDVLVFETAVVATLPEKVKALPPEAKTEVPEVEKGEEEETPPEPKQRKPRQRRLPEAEEAPPPTTPEEEASLELPGLGATQFNQDGYEPVRTGMRLSYAAVRSRGRSGRKLGLPSTVLTIGEFTSHVGRCLLPVVKQSQPGVEDFFELHRFVRRDLIRLNAEAIAEEAGKSLVDASCVARGTDEADICAVLECYADEVYGQMPTT
jgi:hypothetical protein